MKVDVAVIGGGSAGIAASVAAARSGASVVLVERLGMLGGMGSSANVHTVCGLYRLRGGEGEPLVPANAGFPMEFAERLLVTGGAAGPVRMGKLDVLMHVPQDFARIAVELTTGEANLTLLLDSAVVEVIRAGDSIDGLRVESRDRSLDIRPTVVIDTTGDAEVAFLAKAVTHSESPEKLQRPAYVFGLGGLAPGALSEDGKISIARAISYGVRDGKLPVGALGAAFRRGVHPGMGWGTIDLTAEGFDPGQSDSRKMIETKGKELAVIIADFLTGELEGFHSARISSFPVRVGVGKVGG